MPAPVELMCDVPTGYLGALVTLAALIRRAREGGSYHVRISLCQTGCILRISDRQPAAWSGQDVGDGKPGTG